MMAKNGQGDEVEQDGSQVVYINPVDMSVEKWARYQEEVKASLERGDWVPSLVNPLFSLVFRLPSMTLTISLSIDIV